MVLPVKRVCEIIAQIASTLIDFYIHLILGSFFFGPMLVSTLAKRELGLSFG
jgi:hypothetical protein